VDLGLRTRQPAEENTMKKTTALACLLALFCAAGSFAQTNRATITGTVTDSSGAVLPGVSVSATNVDTGVTTPTVTNNDGIYRIPNLFPGNYAVHFEKQGFKSEDRPNTTLESTQVAEINAKLDVGTITQKVTVNDNAPVLDTETANIGTNMNGDVVTDLPLSIYGGGRFVEDFAVALTPGYSPISSPYEAVVNGNQGFTKDFTVDGTSATATIQGDSMEIGPSMEAVQELQATTSGLDSQSAITNGGVMAFNLKSGGNKFHGSAFGYGHNEFLDANTWDNGWTPDPNVPGSTSTRKAEARAWDYGGSIGGPIRRNKTYFFGTFERYTQEDFAPGGFSATVPTSAFLQGNFSALLGSNLCSFSGGSAGPCTSGGTPIFVQNDAGQTVPLQAGMIFDPTTGNQFTGNTIPTGEISTVAQKIIPLYQKYYNPSISTLNQNETLPSQNSPSQTPNEAVIKIDQVLTDKDHLSGSWIYNHRPRTLVDSGGVWSPGTTDGGPMSDARLQLVYSDEFRASETHSFTPNVLNVFNWTYNWYWNGSEPTGSGTNWPQTLGFGNTGADNFPSISFDGAVNGVGETGIGNGWQGNYIGATMITGDSVTWTMGRHAFTFGGDFRAYEIDSHLGSGALNFSFLNATTGAPGQAYSPFVGFGFASFLLGDASSASETTPFNLYGRRKAMSLYAQDSYKVTPKLTLNMGLRWDATFRFHEKYGHWANFNLTAIDPTLGIPGTLQFASGGGDSFEKNEDWRNFGPQIGFAYAPWDRWVFRGAFSITYVPIGTQYFHGVPYGFAPGFQGTNNVTTPFQWDSGYPGVFQPGSTNVDVTQLFTVVSTDPNALDAGYTDNINVGAQYKITPTMRIEAAYVGNRGHRLPDTALAYNEPSASQFFGLINSGVSYNPYGNYVCSPSAAASFGVPYPYPGFCANVFAAIAPYPQLATLMDNDYYDQLFFVGLPKAQTYYNSMVIDLTKRAGNGLTMDLNYTLSRQTGDTYTAFGETYADYTPVQNLADLGEAARTLTNYDQTHIVKGFVSYNLPIGNHHRLLGDKGRVVNAIFGGWTIASVVLYTSGQPFNASVPNPYYPAWGNIYPDYDLSGSTSSIFHQFTVPTGADPTPASNFYYPTSIASNPAYGQLGTGPARLSVLRCPGFANEDASALKQFSMGSDGQYRLQLRTEFYNLFNRHSFAIAGCGGSGATIGAYPTEGLGIVTGASSSPRTGQFAARFEF
jgi:hypothetical protein